MNRGHSPGEDKRTFPDRPFWSRDGRVLFALGLLLFGAGLVLQSHTGAEQPVQTPGTEAQVLEKVSRESTPQVQQAASVASIDTQKAAPQTGGPVAAPSQNSPVPAQKTETPSANNGEPSVAGKGQQSSETAQRNRTITITSGDTSETVARKLQAIGAIADARRFNRYLVESGYATRLQDGTHSLTVGMDEADIAKRLSELR
ncbi:hypothetical protein GTO89_10400 [Heliobacterium gestii]|uniref:Uncharacterized protein n=1 Tax=Heliomicrobium gestii TaxID=2699 RepID=A0A845LFS4_HELGE|nr:endolytic transglycosylase MltG [Heliomicrobium gestii]MBM7867137.1 hypothetical protein [Heliomicrobium gestii]MZP43449.1 hypothetical protein [Heliomicrobium gestii]